MSKKTFKQLINGYLNDTLTQEELTYFLQLIKQKESQKNLQEAIEERLSNQFFSWGTDNDKSAAIFQRIMEIAKNTESVEESKVIGLNLKRKFYPFIKIAAAVVVLLSAIGYLLFSNTEDTRVNRTKSTAQHYQHDIPPGSNKAVLTLSGGSTIVLDDMPDGTLSQQGNTKVIKHNGKLAYTTSGAGAKDNLYNTISTPFGGEYQIELPDGSRVWLNAASSIHFPTAFTSRERQVEISGEAYFEVAPLYAEGKKVPFLVKVKTASLAGYEVQVLGTHFNINAYEDEPMVRTTLAEGKVKVSKGDQSVLLQPAQVAVSDKETGGLNIRSANVEEAIAWKTGMFEFHDANLQSIMRQLSRWYDVEVKFSGAVSTKLYNGSIRRQATLSQVLQILKLAGVNYSIENRTVTVGTTEKKG